MRFFFFFFFERLSKGIRNSNGGKENVATINHQSPCLTTWTLHNQSSYTVETQSTWLRARHRGFGGQLKVQTIIGGILRRSKKKTHLFMTSNIILNFLQNKKTIWPLESFWKDLSCCVSPISIAKIVWKYELNENYMLLPDLLLYKVSPYKRCTC